MPTLSAGQLASMRQIVDSSIGASVLPDGSPSIVDVLENQNGPDGIRGRTDNWVIIASYGCTVTTMTPLMESVRAGKIDAVERYKFQLPNDAVVQDANRLQWNGMLLEVKGVASATDISVETVIYAVRVGK